MNDERMNISMSLNVDENSIMKGIGSIQGRIETSRVEVTGIDEIITEGIRETSIINPLLLILLL